MVGGAHHQPGELPEAEARQGDHRAGWGEGGEVGAPVSRVLLHPRARAQQATAENLYPVKVSGSSSLPTFQDQTFTSRPEQGAGVNK